MSGTDPTPKARPDSRNRNVLVEHATANAIADEGKDKNLKGYDYEAHGGKAGAGKEFSAEEKGSHLIWQPDKVSAHVGQNRDGSQTVVISVGTDDSPFIHNGYTHSAQATVTVDPAGHAKASKAETTDNDGGPSDARVVETANRVAKKIEASVNSGNVQPVKTKFSFKP